MIPRVRRGSLTGYVASVPSLRAEALLEIFHDLITAPLRGVDEAAFRVERNVVENERRLRSENGHPFEVFERLNRAFYGASYFGKPVGGTAESFSRLTLAMRSSLLGFTTDPST